jgi:hypothetical protein
MLFRIAMVVSAYYLGRCGVTVDEVLKLLRMLIEHEEKKK